MSLLLESRVRVWVGGWEETEGGWIFLGLGFWDGGKGKKKGKGERDFEGEIGIEREKIWVRVRFFFFSWERQLQ